MDRERRAVKIAARAEPKLYDLIPFEFAQRQWRALPQSARFSEEKPEHSDWTRDDEMHCPICGWPLSERGFVRMHFPIGHELFGKAICCPECWPAPFGHAQRGRLSQNAEQLADRWERMLRG